MDKRSKILKSYFELLDNGVAVDINSLPEGISKDVVYKETLYKELQHLNKTGGNQGRINEIIAILSPPEEEGDYEA